MSRRDTTSNNNSETSSTHSAMLNSKRSREVEPFQSRMEKIQKIKNNFSRMDQIFKKEEVTQWVCRKCGHIHIGKEAPCQCPVCEHPKAYFQVFVEKY